MVRPKIAVAEGALAGLDEVVRSLAGEADIVSGDVAEPRRLAELTSGADALIVSLQRLTTAHVDALPNTVRVIGRAGVGLDTIDVAAAAQRSIAVVYQPDYATNEVADHAAAMLLGAQRRLVQADARTRADGWASGTDFAPVPALQDSTLGVIGAGRIGRAVIQRLRPFVGTVLAFDLQPHPESADVQWCSDLPNLLRQSNLLTLHLPLTDQTRHIIGAAELAMLPAGAQVVNVSRGGLIDEEAVAAALHSGQLSSAALDVFEVEPLPSDSPLRAAPNTLLSPHIAWYSSASGERLATRSVQDVLAYLRTGCPRFGRFAVTLPNTAGAAEPPSYGVA